MNETPARPESTEEMVPISELKKAWAVTATLQDFIDVIAEAGQLAAKELDKALNKIKELQVEAVDSKTQRLVVATMGLPEKSPQPFSIYSRVNEKSMGLGVQFPDGSVFIKLVDASTRYRPGLEDALKSISYVLNCPVDDLNVLWLADDLGSLADAEAEVENVSASYLEQRSLYAQEKARSADLEAALQKATAQLDEARQGRSDASQMLAKTQAQLELAAAKRDLARKQASEVIADLNDMQREVENQRRDAQRWKGEFEEQKARADSLRRVRNQLIRDYDRVMEERDQAKEKLAQVLRENNLPY